MATVFRDDDVDLSPLYGRRVAVLGYGRPGETQALCLRDSGIDVTVGLEPDDPRRHAAEAEGLMVTTPSEACAGADVISLTSDGARRWSATHPGAIAPTATVLLPEPPTADGTPALAVVDTGGVAIVSLQGSAVEARRRFVDGRGVPAIVAVVRDGGATLDISLAFARALGCIRAGAVLSTPEELAYATAFASAAVGAERLGGILRAGLTVLAAAGCDDDVALLSCWTAVRAAAEGLAGGLGSAGPSGSVDPEELTRLRRLDEQIRAASGASPERALA